MVKKESLKLLILWITLSVIIFSCKKEDDYSINPNVNSLVDEVNADSIKKNVQWLEGMGTRFALASNRKEIANSIKNKFLEYGISNTTLDSFYISTFYEYTNTTYYTWQYNVIATIEGDSDSDIFCIIGGHYDSILNEENAFTSAPGANDNASGVAVTLEVARVLMKKGFNPKTSIQFIAFGAEEFGLFGSFDFAKKSRFANKNIAMMLNNDMVAFWPSNQNNMRVNILDYPNSTELRANAEIACHLYSTLETNNDNTYQGYSDSFSFYLHGYNAIYFTTDADDPYYHTNNDLTSNCNFEICKEITKVNCALLVDYNL